MRINKRTRPADFGAAPGGAATEGVSSDGQVLEQEAAAPAVDLALHRDPDPQSVTPLDPPLARSAVATAKARTPVRHVEDAVDVHAEAFRPPPAWPIYMVALAVAGLWALAPIAFAVGYRNAVAPLTSDTFAMTVFALLAVGPAAFVFFAAYMVRQGQKLGAEARRAKAMAEDMLAPAVSAASRAGDVVQGVREEIVRAGAAADEARDTLLALRDALATESEHLVERTDASIRTTRELTTTLGRERQEMGVLAHSLDAQ